MVFATLHANDTGQAVDRIVSPGRKVVFRSRAELIERPQSPEDLWQITLRGRLELHGVQREVLVPLRLLYQGNKIIAVLEGVAHLAGLENPPLVNKLIEGFVFRE